MLQTLKDTFSYYRLSKKKNKLFVLPKSEINHALHSNNVHLNVVNNLLLVVINAVANVGRTKFLFKIQFKIDNKNGDFSEF